MKVEMEEMQEKEVNELQIDIDIQEKIDMYEEKMGKAEENRRLLLDMERQRLRSQHSAMRDKRAVVVN